MEDISKDSPSNGSPVIEVKDGNQLLDCSLCRGSSRMEVSSCFNCISENLVPGFTGSVVLKGRIDRKYDGAVISILKEHSDILRTIVQMGDDNGDLDIMSRYKIKRIVKISKRTFLEDPIKLLNMKKRILDPLKSSGSTRRQFKLMSQLFSRIEVLVKRMEREAF